MLHVREVTRGRAQRRTCLGPECRGRISSGWQSRSRADALVARHLRAMTVYCLHINRTRSPIHCHGPRRYRRHAPRRARALGLAPRGTTGAQALDCTGINPGMTSHIQFAPGAPVIAVTLIRGPPGYDTVMCYLYTNRDDTVGCGDAAIAFCHLQERAASGGPATLRRGVQTVEQRTRGTGADNRALRLNPHGTRLLRTYVHAQ